MISKTISHNTLSQMDGHHPGFQHMNNNGTMKHCAGCGGKFSIIQFHSYTMEYIDYIFECNFCNFCRQNNGTLFSARTGQILA